MNDATIPAALAERHIPFLAWLGARRESAADGVAVVVVDLVPELLNNHGGGHGGVVMTLLDNAMANAALSRIDFAPRSRDHRHPCRLHEPGDRPAHCHRSRHRRRAICVLLRGRRGGR